MNNIDTFAAFSTCNYADHLSDKSFMDHGIKSLWNPAPRLIGPAFTVKEDANKSLI